MGWSRPNSCSSLRISASVTFGSFSYADSGPPGIAFRIANEATLIPSRSGIACRSRRAIYVPIELRGLQVPVLRIPGDVVPDVPGPATDVRAPRVDPRPLVEPDDHHGVVERLERGRVRRLAGLEIER